MEFRVKRLRSDRAGCLILFACALVYCVVLGETAKHLQHFQRTRPPANAPLYYDEESDFHYEVDDYGEEEETEFDTDYSYPEHQLLPHKYRGPAGNHHHGMADKHMLGYYNKKKPGFAGGGYDYPLPLPYYDDGYLPPPPPSQDSNLYLSPSGPELPPIYPLPPGAKEPPYPPPPFASPDPGFKTQTGFEGFLVPNSWYGLLPWGIEGVIIVIAGIIIFVIIVIAIISVIAWLCGVRKVVPNIVDSLKSDAMSTRMFDAWSPSSNSSTNLVSLSARVLTALEKYELHDTNSKAA